MARETPAILKQETAMIDNLTMQSIVDVLCQLEDRSTRSDREELTVYDETGNALGAVPRLLCHRLGLIHRVSYCFVSKEDRQMLLQTRKGGRVDIAVGGHMKAGEESPKTTVEREMKEELGIVADAARILPVSRYLRMIGPRVEKPNELNREIREVFIYVLSKREQDCLSETFRRREDKENVLEIGWFAVGDVMEAVDRGKAADGLSASLVHYLAWLAEGALAANGPQ